MNVETIRDAAILTTSYVAADVLEKQRNGNMLILYVDFTKGSLTTAEIKIETSSSNVSDDFYTRTSLTTTAWSADVDIFEISLWDTGKYEIILPVFADYIKVSAKGTGTVTSSSMAIKAITGRA